MTQASIDRYKRLFVRGLAIVLGASLVVLISGLIGHREVIMPTFGALMTGGWMIQDNLWHYHRLNLLVSLSIAAVVGLIISKMVAGFGEWIAFPGLYLGFMLVAAILVIGRTQVYPCFGAMSLPIIIHTTSWIYPLSVFLMGVVIISVQYIFEKTGIRKPLDEGEFPDLPLHRRERALYYLRVSMGLIPILAVIIVSHFVFHLDVQMVLQAPLFVTYATFCNGHSAFIRYPVQTWFQLVLAALVGTGALFVGGFLYQQNLLNMDFPYLHAIEVGFAVLCMLCLSRFFHRIFPPAISLAITPFLIQHPLLPLYVAIGAGYFILIAWALRRHPAYENKDLRYL